MLLQHLPGERQATLILLLYLTLAFSITTFICRTLYYTQYKHLGKRPTSPKTTYQVVLLLIVFALLSVLSLGSTWYHMFAFFAYSYRDWACQKGINASPSLLNTVNRLEIEKVELWLRDTKLFEQAWNTVVETPQRFWWSEQIFFWTTGWSLFLGVMSRRYNILHVWAYMLLGQIVAISFAQNLFILAILLSHFANGNVDGLAVAWAPSTLLEILPIGISLLSSAAVPYVANSSSFMPVLLIPHLLLFIPATLTPKMLPKPLGRFRSSSTSVTKRYISIFKWLFAISLVLLCITTYSALMDGSPPPLTRVKDDTCVPVLVQAAVRNPWQRLLGAMHEHPAVSSVGWDVIFCSITFITWAAVNGCNPVRMLGENVMLERGKVMGKGK